MYKFDIEKKLCVVGGKNTTPQLTLATFHFSLSERFGEGGGEQEEHKHITHTWAPDVREKKAD